MSSTARLKPEKTAAPSNKTAAPSNKTRSPGRGPGPIRRAGSKGRLNESPEASVDTKKGNSSTKLAGPILCSVVDLEYLPLAVDLCHWVAEQSNSRIEIDQFVSCLQDGIVLCRLINVMNRHKCDKDGSHFKLIHFRETIGNSVFFARINIETFIRWSKTFGVEESKICSVGDLVDVKDTMQALATVHAVGRRCADLGLPHPNIVDIEIKHDIKYNDIVGLFNPNHGTLTDNERSAKEAFTKLLNHRGLGAMRIDGTLSDQFGTWKKRVVGKWAGSDEPAPVLEPVPPTPTPPPTPDPKPEVKMGPWDNEEVLCLIELYKEQINEFGDDHIDFKAFSKQYTQRYPHRTPHQCWDKMYQLIERYQCDRSANKLFKRKVCSGPYHDQLHLCLGDTDLGKHLNAVYTGMMHPKAPAVPAYMDCDPQEKANEERTGKEQLVEQTSLLKEIHEQLKLIRVQTERNTATNSALLVLLTHVLQGTENTEHTYSEKMPELDTKSLGSDADMEK